MSGTNRHEGRTQMARDEQVRRIVAKLLSQGYHSATIDSYEPRKHTITALSPDNNVRVLIGTGTSWDKCYRDAVGYLKGMS